MTNTVKHGESPSRIITNGNYTYVCYPDYGTTSLDSATWGVRRIDETDPSDIKIEWANGLKTKEFSVTDIVNGDAGVTFKNVV